MTITLPIHVHAFETDFGGVVSNTRYLEYLERGRYALTRGAGLHIGQIWEEQGVQVVLRRVEVDYLSFARHEDDLELSVTVAEHGKTTTRLTFELRRPVDGALIIRAQQVLAYINRSLRPTRVPAVFKDALPANA